MTVSGLICLEYFSVSSTYPTPHMQSATLMHIKTWSNLCLGHLCKNWNKQGRHSWCNESALSTETVSCHTVKLWELCKYTECQVASTCAEIDRDISLYDVCNVYYVDIHWGGQNMSCIDIVWSEYCIDVMWAEHASLNITWYRWAVHVMFYTRSKLDTLCKGFHESGFPYLNILEGVSSLYCCFSAVMWLENHSTDLHLLMAFLALCWTSRPVAFFYSFTDLIFLIVISPLANAIIIPSYMLSLR